MKNKNRFTLRLSDKQLETLQETAKREKRTLAAVIRNLIDDIEKQDSICEIEQGNGCVKGVSKINSNWL